MLYSRPLKMQESERFPWPTEVPWGLLSNGTPYNCDYERSVNHRLHIAVLITASLLLVILNVIGILKNYHRQNRQNWVWDIPGLIIPLKLLDSTPYRFLYCIIMSCWGADMLQSALDKGLYFHSEHGLLDALDFFILSPAVMILCQALAYYPVFCCVEAPIPTLGYLIGFLYSLLLAARSVFTEYVLIHGCSYRGQLLNRDIGISLGVVIPVYLLYLVIAGSFLCLLLREIVRLFLRDSIASHKCRSCDDCAGYRSHVQSLLSRPAVARRSPINPSSLWALLLRGFRYLLPYKSSFRYPLPFIGALFMGWTILYQIVVKSTYDMVIFSNDLLHDIKEFRITVETIDWLLPSLKSRVDRLFEDAISFAKACQIILPMSTVMASGLTAVFTVYMVQTFHKKLRRLFQGDFSHLVASEPLPSRAYRLTAAMRFSAFQVAYLLLSWLVYLLVGLCLSILGLFFYYGFNDFPKLAVHIWSWFMVPMMWGAAVHLLQLFLCKYVFLDRKDSGRFVVIRHRRVYQILAYVLFFFNVIYGFVMCLLRLLGMVIFTIVMLFRMDHDVYMRGLEGWDTGHRTFIGYVYMEYTYNNAVVRMFVKVLLDCVEGEESEESEKEREKARESLLSKNGINRCQVQGRALEKEDEDEGQMLLPNGRLRGVGTIRDSSRNHRRAFHFRSQRPVLSRRARNRWLVAYTLLRNPSLQGLTASRLMERTQQLYDSNSTARLRSYGNLSNTLYTDYGSMDLRMRR